MQTTARTILFVALVLALLWVGLWCVREAQAQESCSQAVGISVRGLSAGSYYAQRARIAHNPTHKAIHKRIVAYIQNHRGVDRWRTLVLHVHPYTRWHQPFFTRGDWPIVRCILWHESGGSSTVVWGLMAIHPMFWQGWNPHDPFANLTFAGWLHYCGAAHGVPWKPWGSWFTGTIWY